MNAPREMRIHVGMASLVTIFSVLCLTIFAVLTLLSANSEQDLSEISADAIQSYYAAEAEVCDRTAALQADLCAGRPIDPTIEVWEEDGIPFYRLTEPIDHARRLECILRGDANGITVAALRTVACSADNTD